MLLYFSLAVSPIQIIPNLDPIILGPNAKSVLPYIFTFDNYLFKRCFLSPIGRIQILTMFEEYGHAQTMIDVLFVAFVFLSLLFFLQICLKRYTELTLMQKRFDYNKNVYTLQMPDL